MTMAPLTMVKDEGRPSGADLCVGGPEGRSGTHHRPPLVTRPAHSGARGEGSDAQFASHVLLHQPAHVVDIMTVGEDHELGESGFERDVASGDCTCCEKCRA